MRVLNVGGGNKHIPIPPYYRGWEHVLLDCDKSGEPDILLDARKLSTLPEAEYDAVYSSHLLEHFGPWELPALVAGMRHVLKPEGWIEARVPDLGGLIQLVANNKLELDAFLYQSPAGPIHVLDVIFGYAPMVQASPFMQHRTGFSQASLVKLLKEGGFSRVWIGAHNLEIQVYGFIGQPSAFARLTLKLPGSQKGKDNGS
jgi:hypothetical protein